VVNFCDEVAEAVTDLQSSYDEFGEYVEAIDEDLGTVEKYFYQNENDDDQEIVFSRSSDDNDSIVITCPNCREELNFKDSDQDYEVVCPECGKIVWTHYVTETAEHGGEEDQPQIDLN
jgi:ssDNA-binding Zn-finger/Zn-ribbon topoisomerase 1